jgi:Icc-related predicted phosphoesterase
MAAMAVSAVPDAQFVLIAGDLTNFGDQKSAQKVIQALAGTESPRKIIAVAGNCDPEPVRRYLHASGYALEGSAESISFGTVAGVGGGLKRAGITSFERTEEELDQSMAKAIGSFSRNSLTIFLTHNPPYGTNADLNRDRHVGSRAFAFHLQKQIPDIWICGHIHESRCVSLEDGTLIINPGPCGEGCFAVVELKEGPQGYKVASAALSR